MKKIISLIVLLAAMTMPAKAQMNLGVKGGLNVTSMSLDAKVLDSSNQMGFFIGPTVKFTLPVVGLGIDASLLYDQRSSDVELESTEGIVLSDQIKQQSIQIPVNVRFGFGLGDAASIYVFAGPQLGFNLSGKKSVFHDAAEWKFSTSNLSGNIGAGVMLLKHIQASVSYNFSLGKTGEFEVENYYAELIGKNGSKSSGKMNAWQLSVAYYF